MIKGEYKQDEGYDGVPNEEAVDPCSVCVERGWV